MENYVDDESFILFDVVPRHGNVDRRVRVTDGFRKIDGKWLIAHEHISVPVDFASGRLVPLKNPANAQPHL